SRKRSSLDDTNVGLHETQSIHGQFLDFRRGIATPQPVPGASRVPSPGASTKRLLRHEGFGSRGLAEHLAPRRQVHRLIAEDAGGGLGEVAISELRNRAEICAYGTLLEVSRETQHVGLSFHLRGRELVVGCILRLSRLTAEFLHRRQEEAGICRVLTFELLSELEYRLLQKSATSGYLIGRRRLVLARKRGVEDVHVVASGFACFLLLGSMSSPAGQESDGGR